MHKGHTQRGELQILFVVKSACGDDDVDAHVAVVAAAVPDFIEWRSSPAPLMRYFQSLVADTCHSRGRKRPLEDLCQGPS